MSRKPKIPSLRGQLLTCGLLCTLAIGTIFLGHPEPKQSAIFVGLPMWQQAVISLGFAVCSAGAASVALAVPRLRQAIPLPESINAIDLTGSKPFQIGFAAGIGEELLFRAAMQPLVGLWWASAVFAIAHVRTATLAGSRFKKIAYLVNVLFAGAALGLVYRYIGLLAAILVHATIDVVSLASLQRLKSGAPSAPVA